MTRKPQYDSILTPSANLRFGKGSFM